MRFISLVLIILSTISCKDSSSEEQSNQDLKWKYVETIKLEGINPIGIDETVNGYVLSDGDHNRIVYIDKDGMILKICQDHLGIRFKDTGGSI